MSAGSMTSWLTLGITLVVTLAVNGVAVIGLQVGRGTRERLLRGLLQMYRDAGVGQYYEAALVTNYNRRYGLFTAIVALLGITAIAIPMVIIAT
jgi:hypothetical protein